MKKIILMLVAGAIMMMATSAMAVTLTVGSSHSGGIHSLVGGTATEEGGGSLDTSFLDGRQLDYLYCVDLFHNISVNTTYAFTEVNNSATIYSKPLTNANQVAYLLGKYGTGGQGDQARALQAAIWHVINGSGVYDLDTAAYATGSTIVTLYNQYITEAANNSGNVANFLWISPGKYAEGETIYQGLVTNNPVPEPGTMMLLGFGMLGLAVYGKRRMNKEA